MKRAYYVLDNIDPEWPTQRHILVKLLDFLEKKILRASSQKDHVIYEGHKFRLSSDFSAILYARRKWSNILSTQGKNRRAKDLMYRKTEFQV